MGAPPAHADVWSRRDATSATYPHPPSSSSSIAVPSSLDAALSQLSDLTPTHFLTPSPPTASAMRSALKLLFEQTAKVAAAGAAVKPEASRKPSTSAAGAQNPNPNLNVTLYVEGFDCEQIWQQVEQTLGHSLKGLKGKVRKVQRMLPDAEEADVDSFFTGSHAENALSGGSGKKGKGGEAAQEDEEEDEDGAGGEGEDGEDDEEDEAAKRALRMLGDGWGSQSEDEEDGEEDMDEEDNELGREDDEDDDDEEDEGGEEEEGLEGIKGDGGLGDLLYSAGALSDEEDEDEEGDGEDEEEDDQEDEGEGTSAKKKRKLSNKMRGEIRYEDFFGSEPPKKDLDRALLNDETDESESGEGEEEEESDEEGVGNKKMKKSEKKQLLDDEGEGKSVAAGEEDVKKPQTAYEREMERMRKRVERLESANLDPKPWLLQGEVTASARPKNSALEVEIDFDHVARPPPVITEEVTASLEEMIIRRIRERQFDDVERRAPRTAPVELKESVQLDDNRSAKGLAEIYEAQYMESSGAAGSTGGTAMDNLKKEASKLFASLCSQLDALAHFHFTPKLVLDESSTPSGAPNVPAVALEEVAPAAVSLASMLAPEEVFVGGQATGGIAGIGVSAGGGVRGTAAGAVAGEGELEPSDRKRIRRKLKRKWKGERKQEGAPAEQGVVGASTRKGGKGTQNALQSASGTSIYSNSSKVFAKLEELQKGGPAAKRGVDPSQQSSKLKASQVKL